MRAMGQGKIWPGSGPSCSFGQKLCECSLFLKLATYQRVEMESAKTGKDGTTRRTCQIRVLTEYIFVLGLTTLLTTQDSPAACGYLIRMSRNSDFCLLGVRSGGTAVTTTWNFLTQVPGSCQQLELHLSIRRHLSQGSFLGHQGNGFFIGPTSQG